MMPTDEDARRDLAADLALCDSATAAPWVVRAEGGWDGDPLGRPRCIARPRPDLAGRYPPRTYGDAFREDAVCLTHCMSRGDMAFVAASREGWPAAIRRAISAEARALGLEAEAARLRAALTEVRRRVEDGSFPRLTASELHVIVSEALREGN
jgi:hypothetical protein